MIERKITTALLSALSDSPVVLLHGARQTGKSTLVKHLIQKYYTAKYITLDDTSVLSAAKNNPEAFISAYDTNLVIDEVQRAPELFLAIKSAVDKERKPGKFILTGSANMLLIPTLSESLAGRIEILNLFPFSQSEIEQSKVNLIDLLFETKFKIPTIPKPDSLLKRIILGGYPEVQTRKNPERRDSWFNSYLTTILQKDIRDIANIEGLIQLPRLLKLFAYRSGSLLNFAEISRSAAIPQTTLKRYVTLLETAFMFYQLQPYSGNLSKRLIKTPKIYLYDSGLLSYLISADEKRYLNEPELLGAVIENFVLTEIIKQVSWSNNHYSLYHYRTSAGQEVDFVIERNDGALIGVEVKATQAPRIEMFAWLKVLAEQIKKKFLRGVLFYNGNEFIAFDKNLFAIPISSLWA